MSRTGLLVALLTAATARASDADPWFGRDKAYHFAACTLLASGGYAAASPFTDRRALRLGAGATLAISAGVAKELWDLAGHGDPSWRDLTWDLIGTAVGLGLARGVDAIVSRQAAGPATARGGLTIEPLRGGVAVGVAGAF